MLKSDIYRYTAYGWSIEVRDIFSKKRKARIAEARHVARYLCYTRLKESLSEIAAFEKINHASVAYSVNIVSEWVKNPRLNKPAMERLDTLLYNLSLGN